MDATKTSKTQNADLKPVTNTGGGSIFSWPLLWAAVATTGFYAAIPYSPVQRELLERYFCGHPMEYALAGLFFLGMSILCIKLLGLGAENRALGTELLDDSAVLDADDPQRRAEAIEKRLTVQPAGTQRSILGQRLRDVCLHIRSRKSAGGLNDHLKYLAELAAERMHAGYALVRTITWAIPILGFLGTVIGITLAISNLTPEQLDRSLNEVTGGLGVAFDTTALALALSVLLVFTSFVVERSEQRILSRVEDFGTRRIAPLFPGSAEASSPIAEAEMHAAKMLVERTGELIDRQTALWSETLEATRQTWLETISSQKQDFDQTLREGMQLTLEDHADQLVETRSEFLTAFRTVSKEMRAAMEESRSAQNAMQETFRESMSDVLVHVREDLHALTEKQSERLDQIAGGIAERVSQWQSELQRATESSREQANELREQKEVLLQLSAQEERLGRLQQQLADNLHTLQSTGNFEETLHSLSAAVHLLTARARPHAA